MDLLGLDENTAMNLSLLLNTVNGHLAYSRFDPLIAGLTDEDIEDVISKMRWEDNP